MSVRDLVEKLQAIPDQHLEVVVEEGWAPDVVRIEHPDPVTRRRFVILLPADRKTPRQRLAERMFH